jgi:MOSC domain-containing protein YiiM
MEREVPDASILSIQVGRPATLRVHGRSVKSAINKQAVVGPVMVRRLNIDGDEQADLRVHGWPDKAVYCYPSEHYAAWRQETRRPLEFGFFGENLTLSGVLETDLHIGDVLSIGGALLQVSQPRLPCFKLGAKYGDQRFVSRFFKSARCGFYCRVLKEGLIEAGQPVEVIERAEHNLTIAESLAATAHS